MAENSKIQWTHHSWNPWRGCQKVSEGCRNCYADATSKRNPAVMGVWGPNGTRVVASESQWQEPLKWDRWAREGTCYRCHGGKKKLQAVCEVCEGKHQIGPYRARVFCASLADVFEDWQGFMKDSGDEPLAFPHNSWQDRRPWMPLSECGGGEVPVRMDHVRSRLLTLIHQTPNLDWLLLTKRPEGIIPTLERIASGSGDGPDLAKQWLHGAAMPNVWLGTSVENQQAADERIPELLKVPAAIRFLSCEPLLGPLDLRPWFDPTGCSCGAEAEVRCRCKGCNHVASFPREETGLFAQLDWIICGGESGPHSRPFEIEWARSLRDQCESASVAFFMKQMGAVAVVESRGPTPDELKADRLSGRKGRLVGFETRLKLIDKKGGDVSQWPEDLRVRQFPEVRR